MGMRRASSAMRAAERRKGRNQSVFLDSKEVLHIFIGSSAGPRLGAGTEEARRAGPAEDDRRDGAAFGQHEAGHLPYLPLGPAAEPEAEEVVQLPRVHRQDQPGPPAVGKDEAGVLGGDSQGQELSVSLVGGTGLPVENCRCLGNYEIGRASCRERV